jgi:hypothetical protein
MRFKIWESPMTRSKNAPLLRFWVSSCLLPVVLATAVTSASAAGEDAPLQLSLTPGTRVRIQAPGAFPGKIVGTINAMSADSLTIEVPGRGEPQSVLREKITRLDVSEGPRSRGVDAAIGAGIGVVVGAAGGAGASSGNHGSQIVSGGAVVGVFAVIGAGVGALIGAAIPPGEHWKPIAPNRYQISFAPTLDHGLDLAVAWRF